jgi:hypothetical protein
VQDKEVQSERIYSQIAKRCGSRKPHRRDFGGAGAWCRTPGAGRTADAGDPLNANLRRRRAAPTREAKSDLRVLRRTAGLGAPGVTLAEILASNKQEIGSVTRPILAAAKRAGKENPFPLQTSLPTLSAGPITAEPANHGAGRRPDPGEPCPAPVIIEDDPDTIGRRIRPATTRRERLFGELGA